MSTPELDLLLDELAERILAQRPHLVAVELGRFVESIHETMRSILGFSDKVLISEWHTHLATVGIVVHNSVYKQLQVIYDYRNIGAHNNADAHGISRSSVERSLAEIREKLPRLCAELGAKDIDLVGELRRKQQASLHQNRATRMEEVILAIGATEAVLSAAQDHVNLLDDRTRRGLEAAPPAARLRRLLALIARGGQVGDECPLRQLARATLACCGDLALGQWLRDDAARLAGLPRPERRVNVFRVEVFPDPDGDGWLVRSADFVHPAHPEVSKAIGAFPVAVADRDALAARILQWFEAGAAVLRSRDLPGDSREFVLHLAIPVEISDGHWEELKTRTPKPPISTHFLCLTIEPLEDERVTAELREPLHPGRDVAVLWEGASPIELARLAGDRSVLLAGPAAWAARVDDRPALLWILDAKAAALVTDHATSAEGLQALLPDGQPHAWVDVLRRVKKLRAEHTLKVFWTDRRYSPVQATSL